MDIVYKTFIVGEDEKYVSNLLETLKVAHNHKHIKNEEWFKWKFFESPNGETQFIFAVKDEVVVGCNAYGIYHLKKQDEVFKAVMPYETFVNPKFQGQGVFNNLLEVAERIALTNDVQLMIAFPNNASLKGFLRRKWVQVERPIRYLVKPLFSLETFTNIADLKNGFVALEASKSNMFVFNNISEQDFGDSIHGVWTKEYLDWRFNKLPQAEYSFIKTESATCLTRNGFRGKLKEAQILFLDFENRKGEILEFKKVLKRIQVENRPNIISFAMSSHYYLYPLIKDLGFYEFPSKGNFTYKILDNSIPSDSPKFSLCGLDFHTY